MPDGWFSLQSKSCLIDALGAVLRLVWCAWQGKRRRTAAAGAGGGGAADEEDELLEKLQQSQQQQQQLSQRDAEEEAAANNMYVFCQPLTGPCCHYPAPIGQRERCS